MVRVRAGSEHNIPHGAVGGQHRGISRVCQSDRSRGSQRAGDDQPAVIDHDAAGKGVGAAEDKLTGVFFL